LIDLGTFSSERTPVRILCSMGNNSSAQTKVSVMVRIQDDQGSTQRQVRTVSFSAFASASPIRSDFAKASCF
jgi:hypothetical protein